MQAWRRFHDGVRDLAKVLTEFQLRVSELAGDAKGNEESWTGAVHRMRRDWIVVCSVSLAVPVVIDDELQQEVQAALDAGERDAARLAPLSMERWTWLKTLSGPLGRISLQVLGAD